jgi:hypothetical protein
MVYDNFSRSVGFWGYTACVCVRVALTEFASISSLLVKVHLKKKSGCRKRKNSTVSDIGNQIPYHLPSTQHARQLVEAVRRPRAVQTCRSNPPACSWDSREVGPAQAPQTTRPEGTQAFLWWICSRALLAPIRARSGAFRPLGGLPMRTSTPSAARLGAVPGRRRGLGLAVLAPQERGGAISQRRWDLGGL